MDLFLSEKITSPEPQMRAGAATVDLNLRSLAPPAIDLNEGIFAVTDNLKPVRFPAILIDLNEDILAVTDANPAHFPALVIDLNEGIFAVTDNLKPVRFPAIFVDFNEDILAVTDDFNPDRFATSAHDLNSGILAAPSVDLNARSLFSWRAIVAGYLRRAARDDQSGECNKHASGSRAGRWARRGHRGAKDAGNRFPLASLRER